VELVALIDQQIAFGRVPRQLLVLRIDSTVVVIGPLPVFSPSKLPCVRESV
jgi:hypothetical protein